MTDAQQAHISRAVAARDLADMIDDDIVITVNGERLECTSSRSPIIPVCIVTGRDVCGTMMLDAVAGPGQTVSDLTLAAYREVVQKRIARAKFATTTEAN